MRLGPFLTTPFFPTNIQNFSELLRKSCGDPREALQRSAPNYFVFTWKAFGGPQLSKPFAQNFHVIFGTALIHSRVYFIMILCHGDRLGPRVIPSSLRNSSTPRHIVTSVSAVVWAATVADEQYISSLSIGIDAPSLFSLV